MSSSAAAGRHRWIIVGTVLQLAMILVGHFNEFVRMNVFAVGGVTISLVVGALYGATSAASAKEGALGGAVVGGACALIGIVVSVLLGDTEPLILVVGTVSSSVTGLIGGAVAAAVRSR